MNAVTPIVADSGTLPALVRNAAQKLAAAETSAEVLEARDTARVAYDAAKSAARIAKAKGAYEEVISAVYHAQADALAIESAAKRRLADEYDAAKAADEVAKGRPKTLPDGNTLPTVADLGISSKDIHEARLIRDAELADPGIVRRTLDDRLAAGVEPNKSALREAVVMAARQGLAPDRNPRRNSDYVNDPAYRMLLRILGPSRAMIEQVEGGQIIIAEAINGFLDDGQRDRALRDIARARDFLTDFLETANAH